MRTITLLSLAILVSAYTFGQDYQEVPTNIPNVGRGAAIWGDYDNDGDLDLFISGVGNGEVRISRIFRNDEGTLVDIQAGLPGLKGSSACWGDYDNDGDLDLAMGGNSDNGDKTYLVENVDGNFTVIEAGLPGISSGDMKFGDYDNDGDLDLFITGNWLADVYRNDNGSFTDIGQDFGYWSSSSVSWGDYDNDGDLDVLITGDSGAGARSKVFKNVAGVFSEAEISLDGLLAGTTDWVDYDNDGDLDIAITGYNDALEAQFKVYQNNGEGNFEQVFLGIEGVALSSVDWGDVDGDGDLDILMSGNGTGCGVIISGIYLNNYPFFNKIATSFSTAIRASLQWADYENDGDLDFIITGLDYTDNPFTKLYRNVDNLNIYFQNTPPEVPEGLFSEVTGGDVVLSWERSTDQQTPEEAISYNIRVGTSPGGEEVLSCMARPEDGRRRIMELGNVNLDTAWTVCMLEPGTYYWSVQAVDQGFIGSAFATEGSFSIIPTSVDESSLPGVQLTVHPNPASERIVVTSGVTGTATITVIDQEGRIVKTVSGSGETSIDIGDLSSGLYFLHEKSSDGERFMKFLKR